VLLNPVEVKKHVGYLPETNPLYDDLLVIEYLSFIAEARKIEKVHIKDTLSRVSKQCSLQEFMYFLISTFSDNLALIHNQHSITHRLNLLQNMCRKNHRF
jgi:ABC-2 type transport system ATP-binding protein